MTNRFVRASKFRHIFGTPNKKENCYDIGKITKSPHEGNMCAINNKFVAVVLESQGGGAFLVAPLGKVGRFDINYPKVSGHKDKVLDIAWNPFDDNQIASSSEDCFIKVWNIPDGGIDSNLEDKDSVQTLALHQKKVLYVVWHPSASNVLLSAGGDNLIVIWNTVTGEPLSQIKGEHNDMIWSVSWNYNGSFLATTCKDKVIRIMNARTAEVVQEGAGHVGNKLSKVVFCGTTNKLFTTGFSRMSERQYALWDPKSLSKPITINNIDSGSGVLFPTWDEGCKVVYIVGKGDSTVKYFEVTGDNVHFLSMYQTKESQRGGAFMLKKDLEHMKCEVMRLYRLTSKGFVEPVTFTVPRKSEMFQEDLFPPCPAGKAALTAEEWIGGADKDPLLVRITANGLEEMSESESQIYDNVLSVTKGGKKEPSVLKRFGSPPPDKPTPVTLEEYRKAYAELLEENKSLRAKLEGK